MGPRAPKLPVHQLVVLAICRVAEPVVLTSVLPYLPEMLEDVGVPKSNLGKWVGLVTATTSCAQGVTAFFWGMLSDYWGRKPVILVGLTSTMIFTILFGLSKSLTQVLTIRAILGLVNGNVGILRTMVAEMVSEPSLQPRAYSILPLVFTIGCILGPSIGGGLARPAERLPSIFDGPSEIWRNYPFLLPNLVAGGFFLTGIITGFLFLQETLTARRASRDPGLILGNKLIYHFRRTTITQGDNGGEHEPLLGSRDTVTEGDSAMVAERPRWVEVFSSQSNLVLLLYALLGFHTMAFDTLLPVFLHLESQPLHANPEVRLPWKFSGGFGMNSQMIGTMSTCVGVFGFLLQMLIFPPIAKRYGILRCLWTASIIYPFLYLAVPFAIFLPPSLQPGGVGLLMFIKLAATTFAFPCCTIQLTKSVGRLSALGTLNGVATSVSSFGRAIGPAVVGATFSFGVQRGYIIIPWWILAAFSTLSILCLRWISDEPKESL